MEKLLSVTDAAIYLGITKELLFAYIRNPVKKHLGYSRTLQTIVKEGQNFFTVDELSNFDAFLKEPWSKNGDIRPSIPSFIQDYLKVEIDGQCPISTKGYPLENAHIDPYHISLNHHHHNLIRISKEEHTKIDNGVNPQSLLKDIKLKLIEALRRKLTSEKENSINSFSPPAPYPTFIGRFSELVQLTNAMVSERLIILQGIGGIGKTQLLLNALDNVNYHNPVIWIDVEGISSLDDLIIILKNALSSYLNVSEAPVEQIIYDFPVTFIFDSLENLLINDRDNTEDFILRLLSKAVSCQLFITSQIDLSLLDQPKKIFKVVGLDDENSTELIEEVLNDERLFNSIKDDDYDWIINFCGGHPLSLKLVASIIIFNNNAERAIKHLKSNGTPKLPTRKIHNKSTSLEICLASIYNIFSDDQKSIIQYLKFYPAGFKVFWAESHFINTDFDACISFLRQFFFVDLFHDSLGFERVSILNPVRPFLNEISKNDLYKDEEGILLEALNSIMMEAILMDSRYIENGIDGSPEYGIRRIEDDWPNIIEAFTLAQEYAFKYEKSSDVKNEEKFLNIIAGIAGALGKFCWARSFFNYGIKLAESGIAANLKLGRFESASTQYMYLSQIYSRRGDKDKFLATSNELNDLAIKTKSIEINIHSSWMKGRLELDAGNHAEALKYFKKAIRLIKNIRNRTAKSDVGEESESEKIKDLNFSFLEGNLALLTSEVGKVYEYSGSYLKAAKYYLESIEIHQKFNDDTNLLSCYYHYANCLTELHQKDKAIECYLIAIVGFKSHGQFEYLLNALASLGGIVEDNPKILEHPFIDEETLNYALEALDSQIKYKLNKEHDIEAYNLGRISHLLLGQFICMIKMFSFSKYGLMLTDWIGDLYEGLNLSGVKFDYFLSILNLGHAIGGVSEWKDLADSRPIMIKTILQSCIIINGGPDLKSKTRIFYWLAVWMQHTGLDINASAEKLWEEAWASLKK